MLNFNDDDSEGEFAPRRLRVGDELFGVVAAPLLLLAVAMMVLSGGGLPLKLLNRYNKEGSFLISPIIAFIASRSSLVMDDSSSDSWTALAMAEADVVCFDGGVDVYGVGDIIFLEED